MNTVMNEVWRHSKFGGSELLVLLAMAELIQPRTRTAVFQIRDLTKRARLKSKEIRSIIKTLETKEEISEFQKEEKFYTATIRPYGPNGHDTKIFTLEPQTAPLTCQTFDAYASAYLGRYGTPPVRNAMINSQIKSFVSRIGSESPQVAVFYVGHNSRFYLGTCHAVGPMLKDAEKLHTEWATNRTVTQSQAVQMERKAGNYKAAEEVINRRRV
jgi:hypothetical protein